MKLWLFALFFSVFSPAAQAQSPPPTASVSAPQLDPATVAVAQRMGLPILPQGSVTGPWPAPGGVAYTDDRHRVSVLMPQAGSIVLARYVQGQVVPELVLTPTGNFRAVHGQLQPLPAPPQDALAWPVAEPMVNALVQILTAWRDAQLQMQPTPIQAASAVSAGMHDTTMRVLEIGFSDEGCTQHYDGVTYLGCW